MTEELRLIIFCIVGRDIHCARSFFSRHGYALVCNEARQLIETDCRCTIGSTRYFRCQVALMSEPQSQFPPSRRSVVFASTATGERKLGACSGNSTYDSTVLSFHHHCHVCYHLSCPVISLSQVRFLHIISVDLLLLVLYKILLLLQNSHKSPGFFLSAPFPLVRSGTLFPTKRCIRSCG